MQLDRLVPMLQTADLQRTIDDYTGTLGFELDATWPDAGFGQPLEGC